MENNNNKINKFVMLISILILSIMGVNATSQQLITSYNFESGSGNVAIDRSNNNVNGLFYGNTKFSSTHQFGDYGVYFDGSNDYLIGVNNNPLPKQLTISYWVKSSNNDYRTILNIYNDNGMSFGLNYDKNNNYKTFWYYDTSNNYQELNLFTNSDNSNFVNLVYVIDFINNNIVTYSNNVLQSNLSLSNVLIDNSTYSLRLGTDRYNNQDYHGYLDEVNIYNGLLNQSQVNQLYNGQLVTLLVDENSNSNVNSTIQDSNIIKTNYPNINNSNITINDNIKVTLNVQADCDLYINNQLTKSYKNILGFSYPVTDLINNDNQYFVYCSKIENNTKSFQLLDNINFTIVKPSKTIDFLIYDKSGNLANNNDLYLVTPCPKDNEFNKYYVPDNQSYYIQSLINGRASFNLSFDGNYNFCLIHGKVNYKDDTYSNDYDFVNVLKKVDLGVLFVGNDTLSYSLKVDDTDLYTPLNPHFWGKDWSALFQLVVGVLLGGFLILIGLFTETNKLVVVGGLIIAIGMGVSFTTFVGAIL